MIESNTVIGVCILIGLFVHLEKEKNEMKQQAVCMYMIANNKTFNRQS